MRLLLIRHGQTEVNVKGVTHKTGDPAVLSELGRKQAEALIPICKENHVEHVYSSPEIRAKETAAIIADGIKRPLNVLEELRERNWGEWEGKPWDEIKKVLDPMDLGQRYTFIPPGGESWEQMDKRLEESIETITKEEKEAVAIVTHEGTLRALVTILNTAPKESSFKLQFANGSVTMFDYINGKFTQLP